MLPVLGLLPLRYLGYAAFPVLEEADEADSDELRSRLKKMSSLQLALLQMQQRKRQIVSNNFYSHVHPILDDEAVTYGRLFQVSRRVSFCTGLDIDQRYC